jgi:methylated-DNA-[protein]-cysteine S-methyltransferase
MTAGKTTRLKALPGWEAWLRDNDRPARAPRLAGDLDAILAAGPKPADWDHARQVLARRLARGVPPPVYYARINRSPVGALWVAVGERGLMAVEFDEPEAEFRRRLERRVARQAVRADDRTIEARQQVLDYLKGRRRHFSLAVDLRHLTPFQRRVLQAAQAVPRGEVSTYGQIARRIGRPRSARAVGQALGSNPVPIVIPCHRILASDGGLGGYSGRGGIRTKRQLLQLEGAKLPESSARRSEGRVR